MCLCPIQPIIQTLDEVASIEIIRGKLIIEVIIIRRENEGKFWFIKSFPYKTSGIGIKIASTEDLSGKAVIIEFKDTITKMQG